MSGMKGNRRTIYTKSIIKESLLQLLETKEIHQITVTDLCKTADVNRGTFYAHYKDAYDLLQTMENELFSQILKYLDETPIEEYSDSLLFNIVELIAQNKKLCKILFCRQRDNKLLDKLIYISNQADLDQLYTLSNKLDKSYSNYYIKYVIGGCIAIIQTWLENDLPESPKEVVEIITSVSILNNNYFNYIK